MSFSIEGIATYAMALCAAAPFIGPLLHGLNYTLAYARALVTNERLIAFGSGLLAPRQLSCGSQATSRKRLSSPRYGIGDANG